MKTVSNFIYASICCLAALLLLWGADLAFSITGDRLWTAAALILAAIPVSALVRRTRLAALGVIVLWVCSFLLLFSAMRSPNPFQRAGSCNTLFAPFDRAAGFQNWMGERTPSVRYAYGVVEDACRILALHAEFARIPHTSDDYRATVEEMTARAPLTMPGVALALIEGSEISLHDRESRRTIDEFKLAADSFGVAEAILKASDAHYSPVPSVPKETDWEVVKALYRRSGFTKESEAALLNWIDSKLEDEIQREVRTSVKRINERLARVEKQLKPGESSDLLAAYRAKIEEYNRFFAKLPPVPGC